MGVHWADVEARAGADVYQLVRQLEAQLTPDQVRVVHELRLAAETLGGIRSARARAAAAVGHGAQPTAALSGGLAGRHRGRAARSDEAASSHAGHNTSTRACRALVVDDDDDIRDLVSTVLREDQYEVRTARHGEEALAVMDEWCPDVILLDLMMPVMDGVAFRRRQRRDPRYAHVPVVAMSAGGTLRSAEPMLTPCEALEKPFDLDYLVKTVNACALSA